LAISSSENANRAHYVDALAQQIICKAAPASIQVRITGRLSRTRPLAATPPAELDAILHTLADFARKIHKNENAGHLG